MKKKTRTCRYLCLILLLAMPAMKSQAQMLGVKTNALGWGAWGSMNLGVEVGFARQWSAEVSAIYNPFAWKENKKTNLWGVQPEVRFWPRHKFAGHFVGIHGHYAQYDWGVKTYVYKGDLFGVGASYGYALMLAKRWNLEGTVGFGFNRLRHDAIFIRKEGPLSQVPYYSENKWGLTKAGITITYFINTTRKP